MGSRLEKNSAAVSKRIAAHTFDNDDGEEYSASTFGGFKDYMRRKKIKLQNRDAVMRGQSDMPAIFRNTVMHINGYTQPSLNELHGLIVTHGGGYMQYLDAKTSVTHIVASQLTPKKRVEFAKYRVVKPAWVVDSVKAGKMLPWSNYRLIEDEGQRVLKFAGGKMETHKVVLENSYVSASNASRYAAEYRQIGQLEGAQLEERLESYQTSDPARSRAESLSAGESVNSSVANPAPDYDNQQIMQRQVRAAEGVDITRLDNDVSFSTEDSPHRTSSVRKRVTFAELPKSHLDDAQPQQQMRHVDEQSLEEAESASIATALISDSLAPDRMLSAEEHNAILLQNPHLAKSSTANPEFVAQYYRESRLHHLSAWKAGLKLRLQDRAAQLSTKQKKKIAMPGTRRYIMHVDFDSFFAAVSLYKHPHLKDKPVVIAHGAGPGSEIASCNYPARQFGVHNGQWMKYALELCPDIKVLPYDYDDYETASKHFYDAILGIEGVVQSISIDEALVDVSEQCIRAGGTNGKENANGAIDREQAKACGIAETLRNAVRERTGCEVSIGIGANVLLAKVALRKAKPAGQHLIKPEDELAFLGELSVQNLPGVAWSIGNKLELIGVKLVKELRELSKEKLVATLGPKTGQKMWNYARGIDEQEVGIQAPRKSISTEINWGIRFTSQAQAEQFLRDLSQELSRRLLENLVKGKQLTFKVMRKSADAGMDPPKNLGHGKCDTFNKSVMLGVATNDKDVIAKEAIAILRSHGFPPGELRGIGIMIQKLQPMQKLAEEAVTESSQKRLQFQPAPRPSAPDKPKSKSILRKTTSPAEQAYQARKKAALGHYLSPSSTDLPGKLAPYPPPFSSEFPALVDLENLIALSPAVREGFLADYHNDRQFRFLQQTVAQSAMSAAAQQGKISLAVFGPPSMKERFRRLIARHKARAQALANPPVVHARREDSPQDTLRYEDYYDDPEEDMYDSYGNLKVVYDDEDRETWEEKCERYDRERNRGPSPTEFDDAQTARQPLIATSGGSGGDPPKEANLEDRTGRPSPTAEVPWSGDEVGELHLSEGIVKSTLLGRIDSNDTFSVGMAFQKWLQDSLRFKPPLPGRKDKKLMVDFFETVLRNESDLAKVTAIFESLAYTIETAAFENAAERQPWREFVWSVEKSIQEELEALEYEPLTLRSCPR